MADQDRRSGILEDVVDLLRLEVPVDRHCIGAEPHRGIGGLEEGDIVAHQDADAVARLDAKLVQAAGDTGGAIGDVGVGSPALTADDAEERRGLIDHCLFHCWRNIAAVYPSWPDLFRPSTSLPQQKRRESPEGAR